MPDASPIQPVRKSPSFSLSLWSARIVAGLAAADFGIFMANTESRYAGAGWIALIGGIFILALGSSTRVSLALVALLPMTVVVNIQKFFFIQAKAPDQYVEHITLYGVELSPWLLAVLCLFVVQILTKPADRVLAEFRVEKLSASGMGLLFASGVLSLINAKNPALVGFELLRILFLYFLTFTIANLNRRAIDVYLYALSVAVLLQGLIAIGQAATGGTLGLEFLGATDVHMDQIDSGLVVGRPSGTIRNPNALGGYFALTLPVLLGLILTEERRWRRARFGGAFLAGLVGLVLSFSRGSWITLPPSLAIVITAVIGRKIFSLKAAAAAVCAFSLCLTAAVFVGPLIVARLTGDDAGSAAARIPVAMAAVSIIRQFPLFGAGLNDFTDSLARYDRTGFTQANLGGIENSFYVHNLYLLVLTETGILGLFALFWYLASPVLLGLRVIRCSRDARDRAIAIGIMAGMLSPVIDGLVDIGFRLGLGAVIIASQIGLLTALRQQTDRRLGSLPVEQPGNPWRVFGRRRAGLASAIPIGLLLATPSASAASYSVGPGRAYETLDSVPWRTLLPGDQLIVQTDIIQERAASIDAHGSANAPIRITAAAGAMPVIHNSLDFSGAAHIVVEGLTVESAKTPGVIIRRGSEDITVRNMIIRKNGLGVWIGDGARGSHHIIDNQISGNATYGIGVDQVANEPGDESVFARNTIYENGHFGIGITGSRFIAEENTIYENGRLQYGVSGIQIYAGGFRGAPRLEGMGNHNIIRFNTIYRTHDDKAYDGNGIQTDLWADDNEIYYNIAYENDGPGIIILGGERNHVYNNTLFDNYQDSGKTHVPGGAELVVAGGDTSIGEPVSRSNLIYNNIAVATRETEAAIGVGRSMPTGSNQFANNLWSNTTNGRLFDWSGEVGDGIARWNVLAGTQSPDLAGAPLFVDLRNLPDGLRLLPESPAAHQGRKLELSRDRVGTPLSPMLQPSIGAYELAP